MVIRVQRGGLARLTVCDRKELVFRSKTLRVLKKRTTSES